MKRRTQKIRIGVSAVIVAAAALGAWLIWNRDSGSSSSSASTSGAVSISEQGLMNVAGSVGHPIYWAGEQPGVTYELTNTADGRVYVRYLPAGVEAGANTPYLTIGTYPLPNAFGATRRIAHAKGAVTIPISGGIATYNVARPQSIYEAFPGSNFQIEVYSPSAAQAKQLVTGKRIIAVTAAAAAATNTQTGAVAVTPASLKSAEAAFGRPIFWLGPERARTYELTVTHDGRAYVRYLPAGVRVGINKPYLTVSTYPVANAYAVTTKASHGPGVVKIPIDGGIAFYSKSRPTSVYVAYKGGNEQIEVFDTSVGRLHSLVASGKLRPAS
jgi:hypothetical protein